MWFVVIQDWFSKPNLIICLLLPLHNHQGLFLVIQQSFIKILLCAGHCGRQEQVALDILSPIINKF